MDAGWHMISVMESLTASTYAPRSFFRNHSYVECDAYRDTPYSGGPYPHSTASETISGLCSEQNFVVWPRTANFDAKPDLIVDPRTLLDYEFRNPKRNCDEVSSEVSCLRFSTGNTDFLPNGAYLLEAEVNVERKLIESDYTNNVSRFRVQL